MTEKRRTPRISVGTGNARVRRQKNSRRQRTVLIIGLIVLLVVLAIPATGYVRTFVLPPRQTVVRVNDTTYSLGYLVNILRTFQFSAQPGESGLDASLPFQIINTIAESELVRQGAPRYGITVTAEEIDHEVRERIMGLSESPNSDLDREFQERYRRYLNTVQLDEAIHKDIVVRDIYREKLRETLGRDVPSVLPHLHLYQLRVATPEIADEIRTQFARGTPFSELVSNFASDPEVIRKEGEVGWIPLEIVPGSDRQIIEQLSVGELSDPQPVFNSELGQTTYSMYLITERVEAREVADENREKLKTNILQEWINEERSNNIVDTRFNSKLYEWVIKQLRLTENRNP